MFFGIYIPKFTNHQYTTLSTHVQLLKCEPKGSFLAVIYPLVSVLHYGPITIKLFSSIKRKAFQQPIALNIDSSLKSLLFTTYFFTS